MSDKEYTEDQKKCTHATLVSVFGPDYDHDLICKSAMIQYNARKEFEAAHAEKHLVNATWTARQRNEGGIDSSRYIYLYNDVNRTQVTLVSTKYRNISGSYYKHNYRPLGKKDTRTSESVYGSRHASG